MDLCTCALRTEMRPNGAGCGLELAEGCNRCGRVECLVQTLFTLCVCHPDFGECAGSSDDFASMAVHKVRHTSLVKAASTCGTLRKCGVHDACVAKLQFLLLVPSKPLLGCLGDDVGGAEEDASVRERNEKQRRSTPRVGPHHDTPSKMTIWRTCESERTLIGLVLKHRFRSTSWQVFRPF